MASVSAVLCALALACQTGTPMERHAIEWLDVSVPKGWHISVTYTEQGGGGEPLGRRALDGVRFEGPDGQFLAIHNEAFGLAGNVDADVWYTVRARSGSCRVETVEPGKLCAKGSPEQGGVACLRGDGRLDGVARFECSKGVLDIRFGNTRREREEDLAQFSAILRTLQLR